jgi:hypothetical protein
VTLFYEPRVKGSVHDLQHAEALLDDDCNVLFVSSRTLFVLQNLAQLDAGFVSRYAAEYLEAGLYRSPETELEISSVADIVNSVILEVSPVTCDLVGTLEAIAGALGSLSGASCGCDVGTGPDTDNGEEGGDPPGPVNGVDWTEPDPIVDRKCKASNYIHNAVRDAVNELNINRADTYAYAGFAFMVSLVATIVGGITLGPFGLLVGAAISAWVSMAAILLRGEASLSVLYDAIVADEDGAICALFEATDAVSARAAYTAVLTANGASALEVEFVEYLLSNNVLDMLFFEWGDSADAIENAVITHDCSACCTSSEGTFDVDLGTFVPTENFDGVEFVGTSEFGFGEHRLQFSIEAPAGCPCVDYDIEIVSHTGAIGGTESGGFTRCDASTSWRWNVQGYENIIGTWDGFNFLISGTGSFTVNIIITEK